jgi:hypothetical protein
MAAGEQTKADSAGRLLRGLLLLMADDPRQHLVLDEGVVSAGTSGIDQRLAVLAGGALDGFETLSVTTLASVKVPPGAPSAIPPVPAVTPATAALAAVRCRAFSPMGARIVAFWGI